MSLYQHQIRPAPQGMNSELDAPALPLERAQVLTGFYPARHGAIELSSLLQELLPSDTGSQFTRIDGVAWYRSAYPLTPTDIGAGIRTKDLVVKIHDNGDLYTHTVRYLGNQFWLILGPATFVGNIGFASSQLASTGAQPIRFCQYEDELFIVREGGLVVKRFFVSSNGVGFLYNCGIDTPATPTSALNGAGALTGSYQHKITYADEKGRESSPSTATTALNPAAQQIRVTFVWPADLQVQTVYIYRNTNGGSVWYRTGSVTSRATTTFDDNATDATILANPQAPLAGENDPPNRASVCAIHKNRLWLNDNNMVDTVSDIGSVSRLQVSNLDNPTQFSVVTDLDIPTDGTSLVVGSDVGDEITGLHSFGSVLGVWKRNSFWAVIGDAVADFPGVSAFEIKHIHDRGCIATNTIARCDGVVCYLSKDGVYGISYADGLEPRKMSNDIESFFTGYTEGTVFL